MGKEKSITEWKLKQFNPQFLVTDLEKTIDFYTNQLGFTIAFRYEDFYCKLIKDEYSINFKLTEQPLNNSFANSDDDDIDAHMIFSIDNIENVWRVIQSKTINIIQSLRDMPYGREFYIADSDGYRIAFIEGK